MNPEQSPKIPALIRRLFASGLLASVIVFVASAFSVPRLLAVLMTQRFAEAERGVMYVAVKKGPESFELVPIEAPTTLLQAAFVVDGDTPSTAASVEPTDRVRVLRRDDATALMQTVWSNDDYVITSRYRVTGKRIVPQSRKVFGLTQAGIGLLISIALAKTFHMLWARRRRARAAEAA